MIIVSEKLKEALKHGNYTARKDGDNLIITSKDGEELAMVKVKSMSPVGRFAIPRREFSPDQFPPGFSGCNFLNK